MGRVEQALLEILKENGGKEYQAALVSKSGFSRSRVSEVLSKMEKEGLVSRSPLGIGKNVNVMLNFKGEWSKDSRSGGSRRKIKRWIRLGFTNAAEYPYVVEFKKLLKDRLDLNADLRIYANGIEVMRDLSLFRLDLGISPILTEFMFYSIGAPIKIIAPAGSGGSSLVVSKENYRMRGSRSKRRKKEVGGGEGEEAGPLIAATKLSTMELLMRSCVKKTLLPKLSRVAYSSSPSEMIHGVSSRLVQGACMWEPYASILLTRRSDEFSRLARYSELGEHICCALGVSSKLESSSPANLDKIRKIFLESLDKMAKLDRTKLIEPYSALTGFAPKLLRQVSKEYTYPQELDPSMVSRQFERAGLEVPAPYSVKDALSSAL
jgi:predicted transcriptional regulator